MALVERGRHLDKVGLDAQDTAELSFTDVHVPVENLIGEEGMGFIYLMQNLRGTPVDRDHGGRGDGVGARGDPAIRQRAQGVR